MADMKQIFTYPSNSGTDWIDPTYIGNATSGLTRRVDELLAGTYRSWSNLNPVSDLSTTNTELMQNLSKFVNYFEDYSHIENLTFYDFWYKPLVVLNKTLIAAPAPISSANTLSPATITTASPHEFTDGMRIQIQGFDGTWGAYHNNDEFYAKVVSNTEIQCASDSGLNNLIGFLQQQTVNLSANDLILEHALIPGSIQLYTGNIGLTPPTGTEVTFTTIQHQGNSLTGNTYYLEEIPSQTNYYAVYEDAALTNLLTLNDIAPLPDTTSVSIVNNTNPAIIETSSQLSANDLKVYVNVPAQWNDSVYRWNSDQIYYLKTTANTLQYEVYTDQAYTAPVDFAPANWIDNSSAYNSLRLNLSLDYTDGQPGIVIPTTMQIVDGDELIIGGTQNIQINDGAGTLANTTYYLKLNTANPGLDNVNSYFLYKDSALTNQLTLSDFTIGSHTVDIDIQDGAASDIEKMKSVYQYSGTDNNNYWVGDFAIKTIAQEDNVDWGITSGDTLTWSGLSSHSAELVTPSSTISNQRVITETTANSDPTVFPFTQTYNTFRRAEFFIDADDLPRWVDPNGGNSLKIKVAGSTANLDNLVGSDYYTVLQTGYSNTDNKYVVSLKNADSSAFMEFPDVPNYNWTKTLTTPAIGGVTQTNPGLVNFAAGTVNIMDRKAEGESIRYSSGNSCPSPIPGRNNVYLIPTGNQNTVNGTLCDEFTLKYLSSLYPAAQGQDVDLSGPWTTTQNPSGLGVYSNLAQTSVTLNSATYLDGSGITIDAGQYVSASFPNKLYIKNMGNSIYDLYKDSALTIPVSHGDWNITDTQFDQDLTVKWDNNQYKVYDSAGNLNSTDVLVKLRNTTSNVEFTDVISDLSVNSSYIAGSDGILYIDDAKTTEAITSFTNAYIDEMIDTAGHSFYPKEGAGNNRLWTEIKDDGNNIVLNDPSNNYYAAFTLDDSSDLDIPVGQSIQVSGINQMPFEYIKTQPVDTLPTANNEPKTVTALGTGSTAYTLNGKKLYSIQNYEAVLCSQKDKDTALYGFNYGLFQNNSDPYNSAWTGLDPELATSGEVKYLHDLDHNTPYMFKTYAGSSSVTDATARSLVGIKLKTSQNGTTANEGDHFLLMNADGWDTGSTPPTSPSYYKAASYRDTIPFPISSTVSVTRNEDGIQQWPAVNVTRTQDITGVDFGEIFGFHNYSNTNNTPRTIDVTWPSFGSVSSTGSEMFPLSATQVAIRRFTIPKLLKHTINNLKEIRGYYQNPGLDPDAITVQVDDTITTNNAYYGYFNSGDIIESSGGSKWMMVKIHQSGSALTLSDDSVANDVNTSTPAFFETSDYSSHNHTLTTIEAEEWCMYRIYDSSYSVAPDNTDFESLVMKDAVIERYTDNSYGVTGGVYMFEPNTTWTNQGTTGWTIKAGNIATASIETDAVYDVTTPEATMQLAVNDEVTVAKYTTNSVGGSETTVTADETFDAWSINPLNPGNLTVTRKAWHMDEMTQKPWITGNVYGTSAAQPNNARSNATTFSSLYTGTGTADIGLPNLVDSTTGTLALGPSQPQPYEGNSVDIIMPGNEKYTYQDTNNNKVGGGQIKSGEWYEPGTEIVAITSQQTDATFTMNVTTPEGDLSSISLATNGRFDNGEPQLRLLESLPNTYVPPVPTQAELEDVWDTDDEWEDYGYAGGQKKWPDHVTPSKADIVYNSPTIVNRSQSGIKYSRSAGHTDWRLDVAYPPMTHSEFQKFHAIAQAAQGQAMPFFFNLSDKNSQPILWRNFKGEPNTTVSPLIKSSVVAGDTTVLLEGFASNESNVFIRGEVFIDGNNENGYLHTSLSETDSNIFGEAKIRTTWPFRTPVGSGSKIYKNPAHAVVTLANDNFEYKVDTNGYYYVSVSFDLDDWK